MKSSKSLVFCILLAYFQLICGHICFLDQLWDDKNGQNRWMLLAHNDDRCSCSKILAKPHIMRACGFNVVAAGVDDKYWYTDKPGLFADRTIWETKELHEMLDCLTHPTETYSRSGTPTSFMVSTDNNLPGKDIILTSAASSSSDDAESETSESLPPPSSPTTDILSTQQRTNNPTSSLLSSTSTKPISTEQVTDKPITSAPSSTATKPISSQQVTDKPTTSAPSSTTTMTSMQTTPCSDDAETYECSNPPAAKLGVEDGTIPEQNLDSSSVDSFHTSNLGRLNGNNYWRNAAEDNSPWIQATLLAISYVHGVLVQGFDSPTSASSWVSSVKIQTGLSVSTLTYIKSSCDQPPFTFTANNKTHALTPVNVNFPRVVVATVVRLEPKDCYKYHYSNPQCTLKFEVLGCVIPASTQLVTDKPTISSTPMSTVSSTTTMSLLTTPCADDDEVNQCDPPTKLGMEDGTIPEQNLDSSSNDGSRSPNHGRLNAINTYWRNAAGDGSPWIQATLLAVSRVHGIFIQGFDTSTSAASYAKSVMIQTGLSVSTLTYIRSSCDQPPLTFTANDKTNALTPVNVNFPRVVVATVVRLEPKDCYKYEHSNIQCTLRFEVLGCTA